MKNAPMAWHQLTWPKNASIVVLFLTDPWPSLPFMKASLRDRGEGLKNSKLYYRVPHHYISSLRTCWSRPWGTRRPRSGRDSSWPAWSPRRPSQGWPCCYTSRHTAASHTLACLPESQILTEMLDVVWLIFYLSIIAFLSTGCNLINFKVSLYTLYQPLYPYSLLGCATLMYFWLTQEICMLGEIISVIVFCPPIWNRFYSIYIFFVPAELFKVKIERMTINW